MYFSLGSCDKRRKNKESTTIFGWQSQAQILLMCWPDIDEKKNTKKESVRVVYRVNCTWSEMGQKYTILRASWLSMSRDILNTQNKKNKYEANLFWPIKNTKMPIYANKWHTSIFREERPSPSPPTAAHKDLCVFHIDNALTMNFHQILSSLTLLPLSSPTAAL